ncbi:MAG TPA: SDR family oxidoreductase [Vicinamibacterales bacterium]|jgi:nucleoside-diphosphate-sugar epimerase
MGVLVTGGCGYIGTKLTEALLARTSHHVTVLDTAWFGNYLKPHPSLTVLTRDIRADGDLEMTDIDTIFHLAGIANDPAAELNSRTSWEVNVLSTMRLIDWAARNGVRQFVFPSSGAVYGVRSEPRVTEDLVLMPISDYNKTKMVAERVIRSYGESMVTTIIRPATVCGLSPRMRLDLTVNGLTLQALTKGRMTVFGGSQVRPNIHIDDLVDLYLFAVEKRLDGVFNAGFENRTVMEIAELIAAEIPATIEVTPSTDPRSYRLNSDRLCATGFRPRKTIADAIRELRAAHEDGRLKDEANCYTVSWMTTHGLG